MVTDLGNNRVLIWNSVPTQNQAPPDLVLGQPDYQRPVNNVQALCEPNGQDADGNNTYPAFASRRSEFPVSP
ncbi:MAG: hypothetical protein R2762_20865 [Bryobacteraceae bacterium]